jgi:hypothetical protein
VTTQGALAATLADSSQRARKTCLWGSHGMCKSSQPHPRRAARRMAVDSRHTCANTTAWVHRRDPDISHVLQASGDGVWMSYHPDAGSMVAVVRMHTALFLRGNNRRGARKADCKRLGEAYTRYSRA